MSSHISTAYTTDCRLLRALAKILDLSAVATTTAFAYLHKIRLGEQACQLTSQELVVACIYVAAKVEEVSVSANQLINSALFLSQPSQQHLLQTLAPFNSPSQSVSQLLLQQHQQTGAAALGGYPQQHASQPGHGQQQRHITPPPAVQQVPAQHLKQQQQQQQQQEEEYASAVVTGDAYYAVKDRLFTAEQVVLRLLSFQLRVQQPHKHLLNYCKLLAAPTVVAAAAVCLLNDAVAYTGLCISHDAAVVAAAALQLAAALVNQSRDTSRSNTTQGKGSASKQAEFARQLAQDDPEFRGAAEQQYLGDKRHSNNSGGTQPATAHVGKSFPSSSAVSGAAIAEGSWVNLLGLQQADVGQVKQLLQQLLHTAC